MRRISFIILLTSFLSYHAQAQLDGSDIITGQSYIISSEILNEKREVQIYVPHGYDTAIQKTYPVLYVMDGQEYFMQGIAYQDMLRFRDKTPPFIVVGLKTDRRRRRKLLYEDSEEFISFLHKELIPYIDRNYRTKKEQERIYFGWEMAGGLGLELLGRQNGLFSGFILASATHSSRRMGDIYELKAVGNDSNEYLLFAVAPEERWTARDSLFMSYFDHGLEASNWRYRVLDREDHYTTPSKAMHEGLSDYFRDYKPIRFYTLKEYDDFGGLEALKSYYQKRGNRYDLSTDIHEETKHFLLLNAVKENNYEQFEYYENEFVGYLEAYTRPIWFDRFGRFYLANGRLQEAFNLFTSGLAKFPNSSLLHFGMGDVYKAQSNREMTKQAYQKAIEIAEEGEESALDDYRKALKGL